MSEVQRDLGIYAAVYVSPIPGKGHKRFFDQFQSRPLRDDLVNGNLHVTTQYPEELGSCGLSAEEQQRLPVVASEIIKRMGKIGFIGTCFQVDAEKGVSGRKKWWTLSVDQESDELFNQCRRLAAEVVNDVLPPINIARYSPEGYHISLVHRGRAGHDNLRTKIEPPSSWQIIGTGVRVTSIAPEHAHASRYVNQPKSRQF